MSAVEELLDCVGAAVGDHLRDVRVRRTRPLELRQEPQEVAHEDPRDAAVADDDDRLPRALVDNASDEPEGPIEDRVERLTTGPLHEAILVPVRMSLGVGFVPVRKLGKLPADVVSVEYDLEYGSATLEMHKDAIAPGARVLIVDDLLATGGTVAGTIELVKQLRGEIVALAFLIELTFLKGRERLQGHDILTLVRY